MKQFHYIFFDLDGTLVDSSEGIKESFDYTFKKLQQDTPSDSVLNTFIGPPLEVSFASLVEESKVAEALHYYRSYYKEKGIHGVKLYPEIPELLKQLKQTGYQLYVTTSKNHSAALDLLANLNIRGQFDDVFGALPDSYHKADIIGRALQVIEAPLSEFIIIGDTKFDIIGGKEAGIKTLAALWGFGSPEDLKAHGADLFAETPLKVAEILENN